jgi:hypothetical protein
MNRKESGLTPSVENEAGAEQDKVTRTLPAGEVKADDRREEKEQEYRRAENYSRTT